MVDVIGYAYEADMHCVACTQKRHAAKGFDCSVARPGEDLDSLDEHDIPYAARDREGNFVGVKFSTDETEPRGEYCGDCHKAIVEPYLPDDVEVFYHDGERVSDDDCWADSDGKPLGAGWYYWSCLPGCMPEGDPSGPFETEAEAERDAIENFCS